VQIAASHSASYHSSDSQVSGGDAVSIMNESLITNRQFPTASVRCAVVVLVSGRREFRTATKTHLRASIFDISSFGAAIREASRILLAGDECGREASVSVVLDI
jgi:hypothetical protein